MPFYKVEGRTSDQRFREEERGSYDYDYGEWTHLTQAFHEEKNQENFITLAQVFKEKRVLLAIYIKEGDDERDLLKDYLAYLDLELRDQDLREITFDTFLTLLRTARRWDFIYDDDEVLQKLDIYPLRRNLDRRSGYEEGLVTLGRGENPAESLPMPSYQEELERIREGGPGYRVKGHPVHYMVLTDDEHLRKKMVENLISTLHSKKRLKSRRYCLVENGIHSKPNIKEFEMLYRSCKGGTVVFTELTMEGDEDDQATGDRDTIEGICRLMKAFRHEVLTIFCLPRTGAQRKRLFYDNLGDISLIELEENYLKSEAAKDFLKDLAGEASMAVDDHLLEQILEDEVYYLPDLRPIFDTWYNDKLKRDIYPQYWDLATIRTKVVEEKPQGSAYDDLMAMVGLEDAKKTLHQALDYDKAHKLFGHMGVAGDRPSMHMVFTGPPGTAKTTVARLFARIMKENRLLTLGHLIEVGRADLVGRYVGWTAPTISKKFKEAMGGVLFIDEAYSLVDDRTGSYGDEAINTIVQEMENRRDDMVVIFAGYPDKMQEFLERNPGLKSRIAFHLNFPDYTTDDLCQIADLMATNLGLQISDEAKAKLSDIFARARKEEDFGNGRYVRNTLEKARMAQASRLLSLDLDKVTPREVRKIEAEDIHMPRDFKEGRKRIGFGA